MQPRLLHFSPPTQCDLHTWVHHHGTSSACARLAIWVIHGGMLWLTSNSPAGKTHLIHSLQQAHPELAVVTPSTSLPALKQVSTWLETLDSHAYWCIDLPAGLMPHNTGLAIFHMIERAKAMNTALLIAWHCPDDKLAPLELASRMRMMEQTCIAPPESDEDLRMVLRAVAKQLQWDISESLINVMINYLPRDLNSQIQALRHLEAASAEERVRISQAWAREKLNV